ncbi:mitochondrial hypoxia responsive domain containing protein [Neofusicoccum parvum]|uniref:Mitochondrial hypoxia responsive domain containing protein n=2 Tax=Neofusicoccum parvum TaxID=310453 RepID=A0ACB5SG16_9PEZI|nr:putative mitochondrial hypoxia responsive domain containing protein [Neofusicoccum parvum UCRNP2]GME39219.1 mitochondrial hypoxia responsive domain containing protein [Neofusicoccum parvum]GME65860.1 mitochondrial hypoxia responsive domain containing protein [Neofusicoccum parvum]
MKILTKEEEQAHYNATVKGGSAGLFAGVLVSGAGVYLASKRYPMFRSLSVPFRTFLVTSGGTFVGIIAADRASRRFDIENNPEKKRLEEEEKAQAELLESGKTSFQRLKDWAGNNRYPIVFAAWLASMGGSFALVSRNPYLSGQQKLVQARVYAQGLTLAVLLASFAFEANDANQGTGRWETVKVLDPNDPTHSHYIEKKIHHERYAGEDQWREMVEAEERKMKAREAAVKAKEEQDRREGKLKQ